MSEPYAIAYIVQEDGKTYLRVLFEDHSMSSYGSKSAFSTELDLPGMTRLQSDLSRAIYTCVTLIK